MKILTAQEKKMISEERHCKKCGHRCHCYSPDCPECVNDVCIKCDCDKFEHRDIPDTFIRNPG